MSEKNNLDPAFRQPWLITPTWLSSMIDQANQVGPEAVAVTQGEALDGTDLVEIRGNVAVVHIQGPILRYSGLFTRFYRCTPIDVLARDLRAAVESPEVGAILLNIDSPGGQVNGTHEMAEMIYQARQVKPVKAYVGGMGTSAAYWLATSAGELVLDATAEVGSIGVVVVYTDWRKFDEKIGVKEIEIVNSSSPKKWPDPATESGQEQIRAQLEALAEVFIGTVARNRGVSAETVQKDFGQGDIIIGARAVELGMADRLGSFEEVLAELSISQDREGKMEITLEMLMENNPELAEALRKEGFDQGLAKGLDQGRAEERERIKGIESLNLPGQETLIDKFKFEEPIGPEQAAVRILQAEKVQRDRFAADMAADAEDSKGITPSYQPEGKKAEEDQTVRDMVDGGNSRRKKA